MTDVMEKTETISSASFVWSPDHSILAALASVSASASTDKFRPLLTNIHLFTRDGEIIAEATDSYTLARVSMPVEASADLDVLVSAKWLTDSLKSFKPSGKRRVDILVGVMDDTISLTGEGKTLSTLVAEGKFPGIDHLIPAEANYKTELGSFQASFLSRMAHVLPSLNKKDESTWSCISMSATSPSLWRRVQHVGDHTFTGLFLQMPVRINLGERR